MTEQEYTCTDCIHYEEIHSIKPLVYCRWFGECGQDTKAIECKEYAHKQFFKGENDENENN